MSDLYLIAHRVRGKPAFDVAKRMRCPICHGVGSHGQLDFGTGEDPGYEGPSCVECDGEGFWWIIPTSGHRAYPYWHCELLGIIQLAYDEQFVFEGQPGLQYTGEPFIPRMPPDWPDHYPTSDRQPERQLDLFALIGAKPKAPADFKRRV